MEHSSIDFQKLSPRSGLGLRIAVVVFWATVLAMLEPEASSNILLYVLAVLGAWLTRLFLYPEIFLEI